MGAALVRLLLKNDWHVIGVGRSEERMSAAVGNSHDGDAAFTMIECDLSKIEALRGLCAKVAELRDLHLLANIAGVWHDADRAFYGPKLAETPGEELEEVMNVGLITPMLLSRAALPALERSSGAILNLSGTFASGGAGWAHYFVSKRGLEELTRATADEYRNRGVRVVCISPADTNTPAYAKFFPEDAAEAQSPDVVAAASYALATDPTFANVSGQIIEIRQNTPSGD